MFGTKPGDGKTSPFGNGRGNSEEQASMAGNDFTRNTGGAPRSSTPARDFLGTSRRQTAATPQSRDLGVNDGAAAGPIPVVEPPATRFGVGAVGRNVTSKPFRTDG